ncbi:MAG: hypothetical protein AAGC67_02830 [Myxococcota bacterium]
MRTWQADDFSGRPSLLKVNNSSWIRWLRLEAAGMLEDEVLTHYAMFTLEDCIEVVSEFAPSVSWLNA